MTLVRNDFSSKEFADLRKDLGEIKADLSGFRVEIRTRFNYLRAILVFNVGLTATALVEAVRPVKGRGRYGSGVYRHAEPELITITKFEVLR